MKREIEIEPMQDGGLVIITQDIDEAGSDCVCKRNFYMPCGGGHDLSNAMKHPEQYSIKIIVEAKETTPESK